jgi:hypothetical protein
MSTPSVADLMQMNYRLTTKLRQTMGELATLRAVYQREDAAEVKRIKEAYHELEFDVVALRQDKSKNSFSDIVDVTDLFDDTANSTTVTLLTEQLESEKSRYILLEEKYNALRRELASENKTQQSVSYSEPSTCVGSPFYTAVLSVEQHMVADIKPKFEDVFKVTSSGRRTLPLLSAPPANETVNPTKRPATTADSSIQRLSKIARFRQQ